MIQVSDYKALRGLMEVPFHPKMVALLLWVAHRYSQATITSAYRKGEKGIHGTNPCRAVDIRSRCFPNPYAIEADINGHWTYDPQRPAKNCALYHDVGQGPHIHLQVCDNTEYLGGGTENVVA